MRVTVDTNILVSALLNERGAPAHIIDAFREGRFTLVTSEPLLEELETVLARPKIVRRGVTPEKAAEFLSLLRSSAEIVPVTGTLHLCRDPKDDMVIETALNGKVSVLVTGDADLIEPVDVAAHLAMSNILVMPVAAFVLLLPGLRPHPLLQLPPDLDVQP